MTAREECILCHRMIAKCAMPQHFRACLCYPGHDGLRAMLKEKLTYQQIAGRCDVSVWTVKKWVDALPPAPDDGLNPLACDGDPFPIRTGVGGCGRCDALEACRVCNAELFVSLCQQDVSDEVLLFERNGIDLTAILTQIAGLNGDLSRFTVRVIVDNEKRRLQREH